MTTAVSSFFGFGTSSPKPTLHATPTTQQPCRRGLTSPSVPSTVATPRAPDFPTKAEWAQSERQYFEGLRRARYDKLKSAVEKLVFPSFHPDSLRYRNPTMSGALKHSYRCARMQYYMPSNKLLPTIYDDDWSEPDDEEVVPMDFEYTPDEAVPMDIKNNPDVVSADVVSAAQDDPFPTMSQWLKTVNNLPERHLIDPSVVQVVQGKRRHVSVNAFKNFAPPAAPFPTKAQWLTAVNSLPKRRLVDPSVAQNVEGKRRRVCIDKLNAPVPFVVPSSLSWSKSVQFHTDLYHIGFLEPFSVSRTSGGKRRRVCFDKLSAPVKIDTPSVESPSADVVAVEVETPPSTVPPSGDNTDTFISFDGDDVDDDDAAVATPSVPPPIPSRSASPVAIVEEPLGSVLSIDGLRRSARLQEQRGSIFSSVDGVRRSARLMSKKKS